MNQQFKNRRYKHFHEKQQTHIFCGHAGRMDHQRLTPISLEVHLALNGLHRSKKYLDQARIKPTAIHSRTVFRNLVRSTSCLEPLTLAHRVHNK